MSEPERRQESLSSVEIAATAKGLAQPKVKVYEGVDEAEVQRLLDLAIKTFETANRRLAMGANLS